MSALARTLLAAIAVSAIGLSTLWAATDGGRALTSEGARRLKALAATRPVPEATLEDAQDRPVPLRSDTNKITLVEFIYTQCPTLCQSAGDAFLKLQTRMRADPGLAPSVRMLSVSFDPENDVRNQLESYAQIHEADGRMWKIVRARPQELRALLDAFGVVVLRDPVFGYVHNAAIHVVRPDGHLVGIYDLDDTNGVLAHLRAMLGRPT